MAMGRWGSDFDPDALAALETRMWKAYYRRQPARLFGLLVRGLHEQAHASWPRALAASLLLTKAAAGFARVDRRLRPLRPDDRPRLPAPRAAGRRRCRRGRPQRAALVGRPPRDRPCGRRRRRRGDHRDCTPRSTTSRATASRRPGACAGIAAEIRDRGAADDPDGPDRAAERAYWPEVARLLRESYRSLHAALAGRLTRSGRP